MLLYFIFTIWCTTALAFETIICNCDNPSAKEHLRTNDENCPTLLKPAQKEVDYVLWTKRKAGIKFQASICGRWMKINHITTDFFGQQIIVPETIALETSHTECVIMAKAKRCTDIQMHLADEKWTHTPEPSTIGAWFSTISPYAVNCVYEETMLIRQGSDDMIETPLGKASILDGIHSHNHLTIIWDTKVATAFDNRPRLLSSRESALIKTSTPGTFRLEDEKQQLAFHIKPEDRCVTTACRHKNESFTVIGDEHLFISIPHFDVDSEESDYDSFRKEATTMSNTSKNATANALEHILNTQASLAAHVQFVRDKLTEQKNKILRVVRNTQCELVRTKPAMARSTAQYDGWLATNILQLPE